MENKHPLPRLMHAQGDRDRNRHRESKVEREMNSDYASMTLQSILFHTRTHTASMPTVTAAASMPTNSGNMLYLAAILLASHSNTQ